MNQPTIAFACCLKGAISFGKTIQGYRQRGAWERLIGYIESSDSLSEFDKAAAFAEGYAKALADCEQIEISIERDLLIIRIVDQWRCYRFHSNTLTTYCVPLPQGNS